MRCKKHAISLAKFDAAQFFKNASINRGIQRINELLARDKQKSKLSSVDFARTNRVQGHLCHGKRKDNNAYKIIRFHELQQVLEFARRDVYFCVGDSILRRTGGWPTGGGPSANPQPL